MLENNHTCIIHLYHIISKIEYFYVSIKSIKNTFLSAGIGTQKNYIFVKANICGIPDWNIINYDKQF